MHSGHVGVRVVFVEENPPDVAFFVGLQACPDVFQRLYSVRVIGFRGWRWFLNFGSFFATGRVAGGRVAVGRVAVGRVAVGRVAVRRVAVRRGVIRRSVVGRFGIGRDLAFFLAASSLTFFLGGLFFAAVVRVVLKLLVGSGIFIVGLVCHSLRSF